MCHNGLELSGIVLGPLSDNQDSMYPDATGHSRIVSGPTKATAFPVKRTGPCSNRHVPLWQMPNNVTYCQQLPTVQAGGSCSDCTQLMTLLPNVGGQVRWRHVKWQQINWHVLFNAGYISV